MMKCKVNICNNDIRSKGYCERHYRQLTTYGKILTEAQVLENIKRPKVLGKHWKIKDTTNMRGKHPKSEFKKGDTPWNKDTKSVMVAWNKGLKMPNDAWNKDKRWFDMQNEKNPNWSGDKVSYRGLHRWVESHLGKGDTCDYCGISGLKGHSIHWSNISGEYRRDTSNWQRLCAKCHGAYDSGKLTVAQIRG